MSAPLFILEAETPLNVTTPKVTAAFNILGKDVLVAYGITADAAATLAITNSGLALTWTQQQVVSVASFGWVSVWTHEVSQSRAAVTVTFTRSGIGSAFMGNVLLFRGSDGVGASSKTNNASGAPTLDLTTTAINSVVVVANSDWSALDGVSRVWRTGAGVLSETTYLRDAAQVTTYGGYHADAGPVGTYAVGLTVPGAQKYSIVAVEVKGSIPPVVLTPRRLRLRAG